MNESLDEMLNEMSTVLLTLQNNVTNVMAGINQLNIIISKIRQNRLNNGSNIKGQMMGNMNNNMGMMMNSNLNMMNNINNMMNNMNNNMMNFNNDILDNNVGFDDDLTGRQNPIFKQIMNMNVDMTNKNLDYDDNNSKIENITVIFRPSGPGFINRAPVMIQCLLTDKISDIIVKYRNISNNNEENVKFIFNAKDLNENLTVREAGLLNSSSIFVVKTN